MRSVEIRERRLRWPVAETLDAELPGARIQTLERRAKYLLFRTDRGTLIGHLGMSGSLRLVSGNLPPGPHDHVDLHLDSGLCLRLLVGLGPEPLGEGFDAAYLHGRARGRRAPVKSFVMDARVVVGVGNIYASEALHLASIHPLRAAGRVSRARLERLVTAVRQVLGDAIVAGGTTLRDFTNGVGEPGYFRQRLRVYGRAGEPCEGCGEPIRQRVIGQRSSFYCIRCQR